PVFPDWIAKMTQLERLDLGFNVLSNIPDLSGLVNLTDLDLQANLIGYFPWHLLQMKQLNLLILGDNPFELTAAERQQLKEIQAVMNQEGKNLTF
ncbi:MAG: hypothetical protein KJ754_13400, partial [Bacteroidetes bacterium]|nr:hypothetical protein [Bacteroidota bacterium]MBU1580422.1 hypothetical protein [Bacteroidota bacterium]